jgi:aminomethyltransferase
MSTDLKRTPLYEEHLKLNGKIVPFAGWELPVQYSGLIEEHHAVRQACGVFDVSHMGEILAAGPEACRSLDYLTCNNVAALTPGRAHYNAIINANGGVVDDIIIYCLDQEKYFVCVNAANCAKDFAWFKDHNTFNCSYTNLSAQYGQLALQGPRAVSVIESLDGGAGLAQLKYFSFEKRKLLGIEVLAARTGYTGEDGFELFIPWDKTALIWQAFIATGKVKPCGLGARDTLRLEACYPLHGHELGDEISALESGLGWIVKFEKACFMGREVLERQKKDGPERSLAGFHVLDPGIVRHADVLENSAGQTIGLVTSGTKTPTLNTALGLGLVQSKYSAVGTEIFALVRGRKLKCQVVKKPFYKKN